MSLRDEFEISFFSLPLSSVGAAIGRQPEAETSDEASGIRHQASGDEGCESVGADAHIGPPHPRTESPVNRHQASGDEGCEAPGEHPVGAAIGRPPAATTHDARHRCMAKMYIGDGLSIIAEQNLDQDYSFELYLDVEKNGKFWKQIALVRAAYHGPNEPVPDTFELLQITSEGDDPEAVEYFNGDVWRTNITLRKSPETGMIPRANGNPLLADLSFRIVDTDNWLAVRFCPEEMEVYVGIIRGLKWWQNLFRLRVQRFSLCCEKFFQKTLDK